MQKQYICEEDLLQDGYRLGVQIFNSGFRPTFIVGLWRGGSSVGIVVQECLAHLGVDADHISIRTSYRGLEHYDRMVAESDTRIRVHGTQYLLERLNVSDGLLIVDDVYSSGSSIKAVIDRLAARSKRNMPRDCRIAVPWYKPQRNRTGRTPDYFLHETDDWLVLPYELNGLSRTEIAAHKPFVTPHLDRVAKCQAGASDT